MPPQYFGRNIFEYLRVCTLGVQHRDERKTKPDYRVMTMERTVLASIRSTDTPTGYSVSPLDQRGLLVTQLQKRWPKWVYVQSAKEPE